MIQEELTIADALDMIDLAEKEPDRMAPPLPPKVLGKLSRHNVTFVCSLILLL